MAAAAPKQPRENAQQAASKPAPVSGQPPEPEGLLIGPALIAAGADIPEEYALSGNRDARMMTRYRMKAREWLESQRWVKRRQKGKEKGPKKWYPPESED